MASFNQEQSSGSSGATLVYPSRGLAFSWQKPRVLKEAMVKGPFVRSNFKSSGIKKQEETPSASMGTLESPIAFQGMLPSQHDLPSPSNHGQMPGLLSCKPILVPQAPDLKIRVLLSQQKLLEVLSEIPTFA